MVSYPRNDCRQLCNSFVLILIVVDNGFVPDDESTNILGTVSLNPYCSGQWFRTGCKWFKQYELTQCLNPYCSGQWFRTRPYKTLLIINKLKNFTKQIFTFLNRKLTIS